MTTNLWLMQVSGVDVWRFKTILNVLLFEVESNCVILQLTWNKVLL